MTNKISRNEFLDGQGRFKTQSLFLEHNYDRNALFTFGDVDKEYKGKLYISLKRLYLETEDITEYEFASKHLAGWNHWKKICGSDTLLIHVARWREELELKLTSRNLLKLSELAESGNYNAAKYLANKEYLSGKGRPTKADKEAQLKRASTDDAETKAESARVLSLVKGNKNG